MSRISMPADVQSDATSHDNVSRHLAKENTLLDVHTNYS